LAGPRLVVRRLLALHVGSLRCRNLSGVEVNRLAVGGAKPALMTQGGLTIAHLKRPLSRQRPTRPGRTRNRVL